MKTVEILPEPQKILNSSGSLTSSQNIVNKGNSPYQEIAQEVQTNRVSDIISFLHNFNNQQGNQLRHPYKVLGAKLIQTPPNSNSNLTNAISLPRHSLFSFMKRSQSKIPEVIDLISDDDEVSEVFPPPRQHEKKFLNKPATNLSSSVFIPIHKSLNLPLNSENTELPVKRIRNESNEGLICIFCKWKFPANFEDSKKQRHIDRCNNREGREDIIEYRDSQREIRRILQNGIETNERKTSDGQINKLCLSEKRYQEHIRLCEEKTKVSKDLNMYSSLSRVSHDISFKKFKKMPRIKNARS